VIQEFGDKNVGWRENLYALRADRERPINILDAPGVVAEDDNRQSSRVRSIEPVRVATDERLALINYRQRT
jgi:hypothetical protein